MGEVLDKLFYGFDSAVFSFFGSLQNSTLNILAHFITFFGSGTFFFILFYLLVFLSFIKRTRIYGLSMLSSMLIGWLITNVILKASIMRMRPYIGLEDTALWNSYSYWYSFAGSPSEPSYSFPSGHTTFAFSVATGLSLAGKRNRQSWAYISIFFAVLVALSRIYLMIHYPSDVVAGVIVGVLSGFLGFLLACTLEKRMDKLKIQSINLNGK